MDAPLRRSAFFSTAHARADDVGTVDALEKKVMLVRPSSKARDFLQLTIRAITRLGLAGFLAVCTGCTESRQVPFNESEFSGTTGRGTGAVTGRAYVLFEDGRTPISNDTVLLAPVTNYTTEAIQRKYVKGQNLEPADPRLAKYVRTVNTDADGNFVIRDIAPGEYYVAGELNWTSSQLDTGDDGIETLMYTDHTQRIFARVSVRNNQTVRILEWNQLSPTRDSFYSYGGTFTRPHYRLLN